MKEKLVKGSTKAAFITALVAVALLVTMDGIARGEAPPYCPSDISKYWMFDETGSPVSFADLLGGESAVCAVCPSPAAGMIGGGQQFGPATDSHVPYDGSLDWGAAASFSAEFWMKIDPANTCDGGQAVAGRVDGSSQLLWWVGCQDGGRAAFVLYARDGTGIGVVGTSALNDGNWHHIAAVRDGVSGQNLIYVDGAPENSAAIVYPEGFDSASAVLNIGWLDTGTYYYFAGIVDELAIYNAALTAEQISLHSFNGPWGIGYCDSASPIITTTAPETATVGELYSYGVEAAGNPAPIFSLSISPPGMTINGATGLIEWTPLEAGPFDVTVEASNGVGTPATQSFTVNVSPAPAAPVITSTPVTTGVAGQLYSYTVTATGNPVPTFSLTTYPSGMTINGATGLIEWTPSGAGSFDVTVEASNGVGAPATQSFTIDVSPAPAAPVITSTPVTTGVAGQLYSYTVTATGNPVPTFSLTTYPSGMTINSTTGLIEWTPSGAGSFDVTVEASNGVGAPATQSFTIDVSPAPAAPAITSTPVTTGVAGQLYSYTVTATGNPAPIFSLSISPPGMTVNSTTGLIEWTPSGAGPFDVTVEASNGVGTPATQSFTVDVVAENHCPAGMTHYWRLDESSGSTYEDYLGSAGATCTNCPSPATGVVGGAQQFGPATNLDVPDDGTFDWGAAASFSVEFWMKTSASSTCAGNQVVVGRNDSSTALHWWVGCWNATGVAAFRLRDKTGGPAEAVLGTRDLTDGKWHHVAAVRDGASGTSKLYVDGRLEGSQTYAYTGGFDSAVGMNIGWMNLNGGYHFSGSTDEVAVYGRALSEVEVRSHYYLSRGYCAMCDTPVRIMPLGDSITRGNSGTITNNNLMVSYRQKLYLDLTNEGYSADFTGSLQSGASASPPFDIDHEGHNGYYASQLTTGVYNWLVANPADVVLLHIGTNDISADHDIGATVAEVAATLDEIDLYDTAVTVVLARIISRTDGKASQTTALNDAVEAMAEARIAAGDRIIMVDQENALSYPSDMEDDLHPAAAGYQKMANVWLNSLVNMMPVCTAEIAPLIISSAATSATVGQPYSYDVNATGNPAPLYTLVGAPPAMTINQETGLIQWTPGAPGSFNVEVRAANAAGSDTQVFTINVAEVPNCPSGMSHYWPLNESAGPSYDDYFGTSNASCFDCPSPVAGTVGGAQQFGATTRLYVPDDGTLDWAAAASFTVEFWMKTDPGSTCAGNQVIVGRNDSSTSLHWWVGCWDSTGVAAFRLSDNAGGPTSAVLGTKDLTDGNWHHVAAVRDGVSGTTKLYVDGQLEGSQSHVYSGGFGSDAFLDIGWMNLDSGFHFQGSIDEVAIYQRALSWSEVLQHFTGGSYDVGLCDPPSSPAIVSTPVTSATAGAAYTYDVNATGNPAPAYALTAAPSGMTVDSATGLIQWVPPAAGSYAVTVRASNGVGSPAYQSFNIEAVMPDPSCVNGLVWLGGLNYQPSIQAAYQSVTQDATLMIAGGETAEALDFGRGGLLVELRGGYDCAFAVRNGNTTVLGSMTVTTGAIVIDAITIR